MSVIDDIFASSKATGGLYRSVHEFADRPDEMGLSVFIRASSPLVVDDNRRIEGMDGRPIEGVTVNSTGTILTAKASLNGLKQLVADPRIISVEGSKRVRLLQTPSP